MILVPLDGSELGEKVLPHAEAIARAMGAEITLLTVLAPPSGGPAAGKVEAIPEAALEAAEALWNEARLYLEKLQRDLRSRGIAARIEILQGDIGGEILGYSEAAGCDLIAMTTHGRSGLSRLIMGSIAEEVVRSAGRPVLLIRGLPA